MGQYADGELDLLYVEVTLLFRTEIVKVTIYGECLW